eukprot:SAG11_NODE_1541_length_4721_cov_6.831458_9_plen_51_part_00
MWAELDHRQILCWRARIKLRHVLLMMLACIVATLGADAVAESYGPVHLAN